MGTALNARHVQQLRRFAPRVVLVFDADAGGDTGVDRALEIFVSQDVDLAVATLPDGLDPCDLLVQQGPDAFRQVLDGAVDALEFKLNQVLAGGRDGRRGRPAAGGGCGAGRHRPGPAVARTGRRGQDAVDGQPDRPAPGSQGGDRMGASGRIANGSAAARRTRAPGPRPERRRRRTQGPGRRRRNGNCSKCCWPSRTWCRRPRRQSGRRRSSIPGLRRLLAGPVRLARRGRTGRRSISCAAGSTTSRLAEHALKLQEVGRRNTDRAGWLRRAARSISQERRLRPAQTGTPEPAAGRQRPRGGPGTAPAADQPKQ